MSAKLAIPALLKIAVFWNEGYGVIGKIPSVISKFYHVTTQIVYVVMWPKIWNLKIYMEKDIITLIW